MSSISTIEPTTQDRSSPTEISQMNRRDFIKSTGKLLLGSALAVSGLRSMAAHSSPASAAPQAGSPPNIILIITDQERYPQHWPEGWAEANLPAHQRLAANGLTFSRAFCNAAMCSPSRSSLFTGLHPAQHGVTMTLTEGGTASPDEPTLQDSVQTMGKMLNSAGYHVVLKGKWHLSKGEDGGIPSSEDVAAFGFQEWEPTAAANDIAVDNFGGGCADWDRMIADQAITFLSTQTAEQTAQQPFMLTVGLGNPHDVLSYPMTWDQEEEDGCTNYADFDLEQGIDILPPTNIENLAANKPTCQAQMVPLIQAGLGPLITEAEKLNYVNFYAGLVKLVDVQIDRVLEAIPSEILDNTIIVFTSDHGEMGLSHGGLRQKAFNIYEETVNIPLIIHNPQLFPTAQSTDAFASLIDLMPTFATLGQVPNREHWTFKGTDLSPLLSNPTTSVQNEVLFTFDDINTAQPNGQIINPVTGEPVPGPPNQIRAIFTQDDDGEWKYARYFDPSGEEADQYEMYHLRDGEGVDVDPYETDNLGNSASENYDNATYVAKRKQLAERLAALEAERLEEQHNIYLPILQNG